MGWCGVGARCLCMLPSAPPIRSAGQQILKEVIDRTRAAAGNRRWIAMRLQHVTRWGRNTASPSNTTTLLVRQAVLPKLGRIGQNWGTNPKAWIHSKGHEHNIQAVPPEEATKAIAFHAWQHQATAASPKRLRPKTQDARGYCPSQTTWQSPTPPLRFCVHAWRLCGRQRSATLQPPRSSPSTTSSSWWWWW